MGGNLHQTQRCLFDVRVDGSVAPHHEDAKALKSVRKGNDGWEDVVVILVVTHMLSLIKLVWKIVIVLLF